MKITTVGTGYVGLVTAALFAKLGNQVWGLDVDKKKIASLKSGKVPFYEPDLEDLVKESIKNKRLHFTSDYQKAVGQSEVVFICVGTPPKADGDYDLQYIFASAKQIAKSLKKYTVIVIKSTVPPNTGSKVRKIMQKETKVSFDIASCPEFLREGSAVKDSLNPSRIVIGTESNQAQEILLKLHKPIKAPRVLCDVVSAQLIKYAANAFLATKISYINSIALLCDKIGADINKVSRGLGLDPRIGQAFLNAGLGYGGSCFAKDTSALVSFSKRQNYNFDFLKQVDQINKLQIDYFVDKVEKLLGGSVKDKIIIVLGLSFKPNTDDMREARSIPIIEKLQKKGAEIRALDPVAIDNAKKILKNVNYFKDPYKALQTADALLLITEWEEYAKLDFTKIKKIMRSPVIVDGRNFLPKEKLKKMGFSYEGVGTR